jgi:hypothetical protein
MLRSAAILGLALAASGSARAAAPSIDSVSGIVDAQNQTITIVGTGFGKLAPYSGNSDFLALDICTNAKCTQKWQAGYNPAGNVIGLIVRSWTNSKIVLGGFTAYYEPYEVVDGDKVTIHVYKPRTGENRKRSNCTLVAGTGPATCH